MKNLDLNNDMLIFGKSMINSELTKKTPDNFCTKVFATLSNGDKIIVVVENRENLEAELEPKHLIENINKFFDTVNNLFLGTWDRYKITVYKESNHFVVK